ncbi:MIP/aquaporin family protein [Candidatus Pelagibacter sp.]|uniref:MIP/aquaporin family protein n=1 Tax=Candidatus Pelagibacter sp. TaxID=2024849 RepID=UPI003D0AA1EE
MIKCKYFKFSNFILEFVGSFLLVFFAAGAVMANAFYNGSIGQLMGGLSSGIILFTLIYTLGNFSRGHVNPAVSYMEYRVGVIQFNTFIFYSFFQILGSICAGYFLKMIFGNIANIGSNLPLLKVEYNYLISFLVEFILSLILAVVIIIISYIQKGSLITLSLCCGLVVCVEVIVFGAITGAAMNPVRAVGPHFAANFPGGLWIYIFGPILAYVLAIEFYKFLLLKKKI